MGQRNKLLHAADFQLEIAGNASGGTLFKSIRDDGAETAAKKPVSPPAAPARPRLSIYDLVSMCDV